MKNITLKMYDMEVVGNGFHTKRFIANLRKILQQGEERALLISATGAHIILMTGRKALIYKEFGPVFSIL